MLRIPTARSMASRAAAKISGRKSKGFSPLAMRLLNSSVFAINSASVRVRMRSSWRFTKSTCLRYRFTMRWFCVPSVLRTIQSRTGIPLKSWLLDMMVFLSARLSAQVSECVRSLCAQRTAARRMCLGREAEPARAGSEVSPHRGARLTGCITRKTVVAARCAGASPLSAARVVRGRSGRLRVAGVPRCRE